METMDPPEQIVEPMPADDAPIAEKVAWLERRDTALDVVTKGLLLHDARDRREAPESVCIPSSGLSVPMSGPSISRQLDIRATIQRLLPELSERQRAVVQTVMLEQKTHKEAARVLDLKEGTLKSLLNAALEVLAVVATPSERSLV